MPAQPLETWVRQQRRRGLFLGLLYSAASAAVAFVLSALTLWIASLFARTAWFMVAPSAGKLSGEVFGWTVAALVLIAIFADSRRVGRDEMQVIPLWLIREYLHIAPRALWQAVRSAGRVGGLARVAAADLAEVFAYLAMRNRSATRADLAARFPHFSWMTLLSQLSLFEGVLVLRSGTAVTLTIALRLELRRLLPRTVRVELPPEDPQTSPVVEPETMAPHELLGVPLNASMFEIKQAYRKRIKECHPDRFAAMDESTRAMAEQWTKALNAAYESLMTGRSGD